jgi:predicted esterase
MTRFAFSLIWLCLLFTPRAEGQLGPNGATASFRGSLPPKPEADVSKGQQATLAKRLVNLMESFRAVRQHPRAADAEIFLKAVRYAIDFDEWYDKTAEDSVKKANTLLDEAARRIESLKKNQTPWLGGSGMKVVGFYSKIDNSPQPYGVEIPEGLSYGAGQQAVPMWIWLHGRGDTATDLNFVYGKLKATKPGQFQPAGTIVIHPFGRFCNGWKSAGETDVFEARDDAVARFNIHPDRIALAGFSMGGAGAWHIGAHYADQWACVHTGAGFVDVKRYQKLTPEMMPPWYEQKLWGTYDVPDAARNFFNVPLVAYSGENDKQRDSAEYMTEVLDNENYTLRHHVGPGVEHKYEPNVAREVQAMVETEVKRGRNPMPDSVVLQFRSARYNKMFWMECLEVENDWDDTRIEASITPGGAMRVTTRNVAAFRVNAAVYRRFAARPYSMTVDGHESFFLDKDPSQTHFYAAKGKDGKWNMGSGPVNPIGSVKAGGTSMEDAFLSRFIVVLPEGDGHSPKVTQWAAAESARFMKRWRSLMRGEVIVKKAGLIAPEDMQNANLILWGDSRSNSMIARVLPKLPLRWTPDEISLHGTNFSTENHVLLATYPNPFAPQRRVVINTGLTFREAHDRTNSIQNPKLPDWAVLNLSQAPNAESAGKVVAADFFDAQWKLKEIMTPVDKR